jgi:hypothetical protein
MKVAHTSTTSTDSAHASGEDEPWLPKIPGPRKPSSLGPRPKPPRQQLTAAMNPLLRDIDWNGHIPTPGPAPIPAYDDNWGRPSAWAAF